VSSVLGGTPAVLATLTTRADGTVQYSYVPQRARTYQLVFDGDAFSAPAASAVRTVAWGPRVTAVFSPAVVEWQQTATLKGGVAPALPGRTLVVQRWTSTGWTTVARPVLSSTSTYGVPVRLPIGRFSYRTVLPAAVDRSAAASPTVTLTVTPRTLVQGVSGPDVLALEKRLTSLHYDVGRVDSLFTYDTRHAVTAFQKVEGLARTGKWTAAERARVLHGVGHDANPGPARRVAADHEYVAGHITKHVELPLRDRPAVDLEGSLVRPAHAPRTSSREDRGREIGWALHGQICHFITQARRS
jgi:hypothetical protein